MAADDSESLGQRLTQRSTSLAGIVVGLGVLLAFVTACERGPRSIAERHLATRIKSTFGISLPCSLRWCDSYLDGGSVGGVVVDRKGDSLQWASSPLMPGLGSRSRAAGIARDRLNAWVDSILLATPFPVYVGVTYYRAAGAKPLPIGGSAESLFIQLLWQAVGADSVFKDASRSHRKRPLAASVARCLQRQRAGEMIMPSRAP
jgi:hypothetical protein